MVSQLSRKRFSVSQYHQMIEMGILTTGDRVELVGGEIVEKYPVDSHHAACVNRFSEQLILHLSDQAQIRVQGPLRLSDESELQPDVSVLRRRDDFYAGGGES